MRRVSARLVLLFLLAVPALPLCLPAPAAAEEEWERVVEAEKRKQDTLVQDALKKKEPLARLIGLYRQRRDNEGTALAEYLLGRVYARDNQIDLSIRHMQEALRRMPAFYFAEYSLAVLHGMKNQAQRAEGYLESVLRRKPDYVAALLLRLDFLRMKQDWPAYKKQVEALLRKDSQNPRLRLMLVEAYMALKDWKRATTVLEGLIAKHPTDVGLRLRWVDCKMGEENWAMAGTELERLHKAYPNEVEIVRKQVRVALGRKDMAEAERLLRTVVAATPKDPQVRVLLIQALIEQARFPEAERDLRDLLALVRSDERLRDMRAWVLSMLALALAEQGKEAEAVRVLEELDGIEKLPPSLLDMWQVLLGKLARHKERIKIFKRMLPFLEGRPDARKKVQEVIEILERGGTAPADEDGVFGQKKLEDLMRRCTGADVEGRRKALHEYYEKDLPFVDPVIYHRHDPRIEPDADCRYWVVKILGRFHRGRADGGIVRIAARYAGFALEDPDSTVRRGAAQALAEIKAPAGLLYLLPHLASMPVINAPTTGAVSKDLEREYNAVRGALAAITGRADIAIGGEAWVTLPNAPANRDGWRIWLDTSEGVAARVAAMDDLAEVDDIDPRWHLRYILVDVIQTEPPVPPAVALRAYEVLRDRIVALPADKRSSDPWWRVFPVLQGEAATQATLPAIRKAVDAWWRSLPRTRKGAR